MFRQNALSCPLAHATATGRIPRQLASESPSLPECPVRAHFPSDLERAFDVTIVLHEVTATMPRKLDIPEFQVADVWSLAQPALVESQQCLCTAEILEKFVVVEMFTNMSSHSSPDS